MTSKKLRELINKVKSDQATASEIYALHSWLNDTTIKNHPLYSIGMLSDSAKYREVRLNG